MKQETSAGGAGRQAWQYLFYFIELGLFILAITAYYSRQWILGSLYIGLMFALFCWRNWNTINLGMEMIETAIWGMPIKDPDWRTKRMKRRIVWKWKQKKD